MAPTTPPFPTQPSTYNLLSRLTNSRPTIAYAALLDPTGVFRSHLPPTPDPLQTHLSDVLTDLRLSSHSASADAITELLTPALIEHSALQVILLLARPRTESNRPTPPRFFKEPIDGLTSSSPAQKSYGLFNTPPHEPVTPNRNRSSPKSPPPDHDVIQARARFALAERLHRSRLLSASPPYRLPVPHDAHFLSWLQMRAGKKRELVARPSIPQHHVENPDITPAEHDAAFCTHLLALSHLGPSPVSPEAPTASSPTPLPALLLRRVPPSHPSYRALLARLRTPVAPPLPPPTPASPASPSLSKLVTRATEHGDLVSSLMSFALAYADAHATRCLHAVAVYTSRVLSSHTRSLMRASFPSALLHAAEACRPLLHALWQAHALLEQTPGTDAAVLSALAAHAAAHPLQALPAALLDVSAAPYTQLCLDWALCASTRRDAAGVFFASVLGVSVVGAETLSAVEGHTSALEEDVKDAVFPIAFFTQDQTTFLLRAGRARALLDRFRPTLAFLKIHSVEVDVAEVEDIYALCDRLWRLAKSIDAADVHDANDGENEGLSAGDVHRCTPTGCTSPVRAFRDRNRSPVVENDALLGGSQGVRPQPEQSSRPRDSNAFGMCFCLPNMCNAALDNHEGPGEDDRTESDKPPSKGKGIFTAPSENGGIADLCHLDNCQAPMRPPPCVLYGTVMLEPLRKIDAIVQKHALCFFIQDLDVCGHFHNIRAHVLLGAGDFADVLVEQIDAAARISEENERYIRRRANAAMTFYGTTGPGVRSIRDRTHLNRCLAAAMNLSGNDVRPHTSRLSLDALPQGSGTKSTALWDCAMDVKYEVEYPLDMMLSESMLGVYSKIFDLFLRVLRAKKSLRSLFMLSRRHSVLRQSAQKRGLSNRRLRATLWQFCWEAEHFVSIFGGFEMDQVLRATWDTFERSWSTVGSIWALRDAHVQYLDDCVRRCLLGEKHKSVLGVMTGGFEIVVKVEKQISASCISDKFLPHTAANDTLDLLVSALASLRRRSAFLVDVLERLLEEGMHAHLEDLLTRLRFGRQGMGASLA